MTCMLIAWIIGICFKIGAKGIVGVAAGERMFSVSCQQDLTKALIISCLFMQRGLQVPCNGRQSLLSRLCKKRGIGRQHTTFTPIQNTACSNELFSPSGRFCFGGKTFWLSKCEFWPLIKYISYWEVVTRILIFSGRHDLPSDARAFSFLAPLEM